MRVWCGVGALFYGLRFRERGVSALSWNCVAVKSHGTAWLWLQEFVVGRVG